MGNLTIHHNGMVAISKNILLDDKLSLAAKGLYSIIIAELDHNDSVEELNCLTNPNYQEALYELIKNNIIIKTEVDGQFNYDVR